MAWCLSRGRGLKPYLSRNFANGGMGDLSCEEEEGSEDPSPSTQSERDLTSPCSRGVSWRVATIALDDAGSTGRLDTHFDVGSDTTVSMVSGRPPPCLGGNVLGLRDSTMPLWYS